MNTFTVPAWYYQQFDADYALDVPGEGYGGWKSEDVELSLDHTAMVVMHAWDFGTREQYPGWHRAVEYIPRAEQICAEIFPPLLTAVRRSGVPLLHVVNPGRYYQEYPGFQKAVALAGATPERPKGIKPDETHKRLREFRAAKVFVGTHNAEDVRQGFANLDFAPQARPVGDEGIAENGHQLFALCQNAGINHLIYAGFAINWCLLLSPGGMAEMHARGFLCSVFRQAVSAVENKETARLELCKEIGLWRVALAYGFVFDVEPFIRVCEGLACRE